MMLSRFFGRRKEYNKQVNRRILKSRLRRLHLESLEQRVVLASDYENAFVGKDINDDGFITSIDALVAINQLYRSSGTLPVLGGGQLPPAYYDVNGDGALTSLDPLIVINHLFRSNPSSVDAKYISPANLQTMRTATESGKPTIVKFSMTNENFNVNGSEALVRFIVSPTTSSTFDPGAIVVRNSKGEAVTATTSSNNTPFSKSSFTIVALTVGEYSLEVSGENGTTGAFDISTSLVGDANKDGTVNDLDRKAVGAHLQNRSYDIGADANLDGVITGEDYNWGRSNTGDSTSLISTPPKSGISQDDSVKADRKSLLTVPVANSLLINDDFRNPFPVGLTIKSFQAKSDFGADIAVNPDGSFSYDPRNAAELTSLKTGEVKIDRFKYKTSDNDESTVNVAVEGVSDGSDDTYTTTEDVVLQVDASTGLLANDSGTGVTVVIFDAISSRGANVQVQADGSFSYDPQAALDLQQLVAGNHLTDFFKYQATDSQGKLTTGVVSIKVNGLNDAPIANADHFFLSQDNPKTVANILGNDIDLDFAVANLPVTGKGLTAIAKTTQSTLGASIKIGADGKFEYDASTLASIANLNRDETLTDTVEYTISDGVIESKSIVSITVRGIQHLPVASDDQYEVTYPHSKVIRASIGVLANDSDFDKNDILRVISTTPDLPTEKGGMVTLFEEGSFVYQSGPAFFSNGAPELQDGEVGVDSFTYTVSDGHGGEKTATVRFKVMGSKNPFDDEYVANKTEVLTIDATTGLFINDPFAHLKIVTSPAESRQRAKVTVNPDDGSFTYDATASLNLVTDENGVAYDSFEYTAQDAIDTSRVFTATARIKVYTDPTAIVSVGSGTAYNPSIKAEVVNGVLKLETLQPSAFGGEISVQTFDVTGSDSQGNALPPKIRVAAMHTAIIPATATEPAKSITQRIVVGDFDSNSFTSIDFQGNTGKDVLFITNSGNYTVTARGGDGDDWLQAGVGIADLEGGNGNDTLLAAAVRSFLSGGPGNDELVGGPGDDILQGGDGDDELFGNEGDDVLFGDAGIDYLRGDAGTDRMNGGDGGDRFQDSSNTSEPSWLVNVNPSEGDRYSLGESVPRNSFVTGIKTTRQSSSDLRTQGGVLVAAIPDMTEDAGGNKTGTTLTINGPTGYGYTLKGNWTVTRNASGEESFTNQGDLTIVTGYGDVTIPTLDAAKVVITTTSDIVDGVGVLKATFNLQDFLINLISGDSQASANFAQQLKDNAGMELNFPSALSFGFGLGSEIRAISGFGSVPLADPLPYFYFRFAMGADLVKLGDNTLSSNISGEVIIAFDPLDPMLFVKVVPPVGGISIGLAGSKNGYIPFRPENSLPLHSFFLDAIDFSNPFRPQVKDQSIFGHVYLEGSIDISEFVPEVPLELQGNLVLDLDANDDGTLVGGIGSLADDILISKAPGAIKRAFGSVFGDLALGINGQVNLVAPLPGKILSLSVPLAGATIVAKKEVFAFSGGSLQPFKDVPFLNGITVSSSRIEGFISKSGSFSFDYYLSSPKFYGVALNNTNGAFRIQNSGAFLSGSVATPLGPNVNVAGSLDFQTGAFNFTGSVGYSIDLKIFNPTVNLQVTLSNYGAQGYGLYFTGSFRAMYDDPLGFCDAHLDLTLRFTAAENGFDIGGSCAVYLDLPKPLIIPYDPDVRFTISVSTSGFSVDLGILGTYIISW